MKIKKDSKVGEDFFERLRMKSVDPKKFKINDEPGFKLEEEVNNYRIFTLRQEGGKEKQHWYCTTVFNGPEPKDILAQTRSYKFKEAIKIHYNSLNHLATL